MADIPVSPEGLTADWLSGALGAPITACDATPLTAGRGILGQISRSP